MADFDSLAALVRRRRWRRRRRIKEDPRRRPRACEVAKWKWAKSVKAAKAAAK